MSYFAHAFAKAFPVNPETGTSAATGAVLDNGFITNDGISTADLRATADDLVNAPFNAAVGPVFGLFGRDSYLSVDAASPEILNGAPLILASSSILTNDKIGQFHGGYAESNKSKYINPRYVEAAYKLTAQTVQQSIWHIGVTNAQPGTSLDPTTLVTGGGYPTDGTFTNVATTVLPLGGTGMTVDITVVGGVVTSIVENQVGIGYAIGDVITVADDAVTGVPTTAAEIEVLTVGAQDCEFTFLCDETYNLFINLSGSPVLRHLNHDAYRKLAAYTGCCPSDTIEPTPVDSTLVFADWATQIITTPYLKDFVRPIVFDQAGNPWFATAEEAVAEGWPATQVWSSYVSSGYVEGALGGMRLIGAYVDTEFGNCTFQVSDYFNKDFVKMDITLSDEEGNPCDFNGLCTFEECCGFNGQGFGDTYLKEIILCESYLQNNFSSDPRIREITQGNALRDVVDRYAFYDKYVIEHTVPRTNNPSGVHDNDKYNLCIYVPTGADLSTFEDLIADWLTNAGNHLGAELDTNGGFIDYGDRTACVVAPLPVFVP